MILARQPTPPNPSKQPANNQQTRTGQRPIETSAIHAQARALGFDAVGITTPALAARHRQDLCAFLGDGRHGDMTWLAERAHLRCDPQALWADARSVICLGLNYAPPEDPRAALRTPGRAAIAAYARGQDYHTLLKARLKTLGRWLSARFGGAAKVFCDTAPVMEKSLAQRAGLGWIGKHTNLVSRRFGSWLLLGEVFTTLALRPDPPHADRCGRCRACIDACPTGALTAPYRIDARRCIAYLTIEHKGAIAGDLAARLGNRVFGCDDCLAVCPWNKFAQGSAHAAFVPRPGLARPTLAELAGLDEAGFRALFAGTAIKRTGRDRFVRTIAHALANQGGAAAAAVLRRLRNDGAVLVAEAAHQGLAAERAAAPVADKAAGAAAPAGWARDDG